MSTTLLVRLSVWGVIQSLSTFAPSKTPPPSRGTQNAITGINSHAGPGLIKYEPAGEPNDRRIDLFLSDWRGSTPLRHSSGDFVFRNV